MDSYSVTIAVNSFHSPIICFYLTIDNTSFKLSSLKPNLAERHANETEKIVSSSF